MIKCASFYDIAKDILVACELDSDTCTGTNQKKSEAIIMSIRKLDPYNPEVSNYSMHVVSTYSGSISVSNELVREY